MEVFRWNTASQYTSIRRKNVFGFQTNESILSVTVLLKKIWCYFGNEVCNSI